jgi:hypothetical protein
MGINHADTAGSRWHIWGMRGVKSEVNQWAKKEDDRRLGKES